jgi:predicted GH43/DUF377 family glycosyl hydrolase
MAIRALCRVEDRTGLSHLCAARTAKGIDAWRIDSQPTLMANPREYPAEVWGIEDPRISYVPELEQSAFACTAFARGGSGVSPALTRDFKTGEILRSEIPAHSFARHMRSVAVSEMVSSEAKRPSRRGHRAVYACPPIFPVSSMAISGVESRVL